MRSILKRSGRARWVPARARPLRRVGILTSLPGAYTSQDFPRVSTSAVDLFQHGAATLAHRRIPLILAHAGRIIPAALTLQPISLFHLNVHRSRAVSGGFG